MAKVFMEQEDNKFNYGEAVIISKKAPKEFHPGESVSVCGFRRINSDGDVKQPLFDKDAWVYTVELGNGQSLEIAECFLEKDLTISGFQEIRNMTHYFHLGHVKKFSVSLSQIELFIQKDLRVFERSVLFSENKINGILYLIGIKSLYIKNSLPFSSNKEMFFGSLEDFNISGDKVTLKIEWQNSLLNFIKDDWSLIEIEVENLWWRSIPTNS